MAGSYHTPGVYIVDTNPNPTSVVQVPTAIPVFIGYTEKAVYQDKSLIKVPTYISSLEQYMEIFGKEFQSSFGIAQAPANYTGESFMVHDQVMILEAREQYRSNFYPAMQLFYENGGKECYVLSLGTYGDKESAFVMDLKDYYGDVNTPGIFQILEEMSDPTLVVLPDVTIFGNEAYPLYQQVLAHCSKMMNRFAILDVVQNALSSLDTEISNFRDAIGSVNLNYGAAYYPWLETDVLLEGDVDFKYLDASVDLSAILPEPEVQATLAEMKAMTKEQVASSRSPLHAKLTAASETYFSIMEGIRKVLNLLPASPAMAGIYCKVDNTRGVWKAPSNLPLIDVTAPAILISDAQQQFMNLDDEAGKSVNAIRAFPGVGTLSWGARTLDGNSFEWRYISVRRTLIMIEESTRMCLRGMIFESNTVETWEKVKTMICIFLASLWKQGALAGVKPEQAYNVQVGLGTTMTSEDVISNKMNVMLQVAVVRPSEFIIVTLTQLMATS